MHAVRLLEGAKEILTTGDFHTYRENHEELLKCRSGYYTVSQAIDIVNSLEKELDELYETSDKVPHSPDFNKINEWLIRLNKRALGIMVISDVHSFSGESAEIEVEAAKRAVTNINR
jgi:hypothetical protein